MSPQSMQRTEPSKLSSYFLLRIFLLKVIKRQSFSVFSGVIKRQLLFSPNIKNFTSVFAEISEILPLRFQKKIFSFVKMAELKVSKCSFGCPMTKFQLDDLKNSKIWFVRLFVTPILRELQRQGEAN